MKDIAAALSAIHNSPIWLCDHLLKHNTYFMIEDENITFRTLLETNYRNLVNKIGLIRRSQNNHCLSIEFRYFLRHFSIIRDIYITLNLVLTTLSSTKFIELEKKGENNSIAILRINRPEVLNAINIDTIKELSSLFDSIDSEDSAKVVIITGTGERSFCAGADLKYVVDKSPIDAERYASTIHALLNKIENFRKPVIAAINGYALGGGCEIALACDIRIASSNAKIGQAEVKVGIPPGWGGTQRMLRLLRVSKAKELIYTGRMITAEEAYQIGLVNKVVYPDKQETQGTESLKNNANNNSKVGVSNKGPVESQNSKLIADCVELANTILKNSQFAVTVSKMLINKALDVDISAGLSLEIYGWSLCFAHEDRVKMMSAFLNKKIK